jgi:hypothetical protein
MDQKKGPRTHSHGLRQRRPRAYGHLHTVLEEAVLTQFNMIRGIKEFGDLGTAAVLKELQQLHDRNALDPIDSVSLSSEE